MRWSFYTVEVDDAGGYAVRLINSTQNAYTEENSLCRSVDSATATQAYQVQNGSGLTDIPPFTARIYCGIFGGEMLVNSGLGYRFSTLTG